MVRCTGRQLFFAPNYLALPPNMPRLSRLVLVCRDHKRQKLTNIASAGEGQRSPPSFNIPFMFSRGDGRLQKRELNTCMGAFYPAKGPSSPQIYTVWLTVTLIPAGHETRFSSVAEVSSPYIKKRIPFIFVM